MMKYLELVFVLLCFTHLNMKGQSYDASQVSQFANCLSKWTSTQKSSYRFEAENLCKGEIKPIVSDELSHILSSKENMPIQKSYELETYLNNIGRLVNRNSLSIKYSDFKSISKTEINDVNLNYKYFKDMEFYSCRIRVNGAIVHESTELFYVYKSKIVKITKFEKIQGKIIVDFDDFINDYETVGFSYNYGINFPVGGSFNYSLESVPFMLSVDFGLNLDDDKYIIDKVEFKDIMNYSREKKILDPKFFITITPQVYFKYFSIGCGGGILYMNGTKETTSCTSSSSSTSGSSISISSSSSSSSSSEENEIMVKPMIRPVVKGFIPISDEFFISVSVGYDLIFGYKDKNGINFGIGVQWEL